MQHQLFPKWMNLFPTAATMGAIGGLVLIVAGVTYYFTPKFWEVGYEPEQPVAFSHQTHAGQLGIDCRYCHHNVERSEYSNVPATSTCMSCHTVTDEVSGYLALATSSDGSTPSPHWQSADLQAVRSAYASDEPIEWRRVHKIPEYAHFNHAVHVNAGVSCYSCHGRIDQMPEVYQSEPLSMGWCLNCHRAPENHLIDTTEVEVTKLWEVEETLAQDDYAERIGRRLAERLRSQPPEHCGACHY